MMSKKPNSNSKEKIILRIIPSDTILFAQSHGLGSNDSTLRNLDSYDSIPMIFSGMLKSLIVQELMNKYDCYNIQN